jgi:hypothetical protein
MKDSFVFNVLVFADKEWYIYTQCDSARYAEKCLARFIEETPRNQYHSTLITFLPRSDRLHSWDFYRHWE